MDKEVPLKEEEHHKQYELCTTRPPYRQGRKLTAVKVYTINSESQHLFIYGVPKINLRNELKSLCIKYGKIINIHVVTDHKTEQFTECYHVQYERIQSARIAKRLLDNKSFYGGILHACYVPEYETLAETKGKLQQRIKDVTTRLNSNHETLLGSANQETDVNLEDFKHVTKTQLKKKRRLTENNAQSSSSSNKRFKQSKLQECDTSE